MPFDYALWGHKVAGKRIAIHVVGKIIQNNDAGKRIQNRIAGKRICQNNARKIIPNMSQGREYQTCLAEDNIKNVPGKIKPNMSQ